jgi:hypothetical protein
VGLVVVACSLNRGLRLSFVFLKGDLLCLI